MPGIAHIAVLLWIVVARIRLTEAQYPANIPTKRCLNYFLDYEAAVTDCTNHCRGSMETRWIPCIGDLTPWEPVPDVCRCEQDISSCHMGRRDVCLYPPQTWESCQAQKGDAWSCTIGPGEIHQWLCTSFSSRLMTVYSGIPCDPSKAPTPSFPPVPADKVTVGSYSFFNLWSYNEQYHWVVFYVIFTLLLLGLFLFCTYCCHLTYSFSWCCYSNERWNRFNAQHYNQENIHLISNDQKKVEV